METLSEGERQAHLQSYYLADLTQEVVGDNCVSIRRNENMAEWIVPEEKELDEEEISYMKEHGAVELVRCKDCKWFEMPRYGERGLCKHLDIVTGTVWFCADGRKRE